MKYLAIEIENDGAKNEPFTPHLKNESLKVLEYYEKGVIREIYFDQFHCAILVLECNSINEAENIINTLPLVKNGLIHFEIRELLPYTGFSRLLQ
ncbi:MAG: superoxide dismutase [Bacteroidales bacterium]|nr:superoxide dismutase [Bacteroidales bacterium]